VVAELYPALVRLAAGLVRDVRLAEEMVRDSFVAMYGGWQRPGDAEAALAYLRQAVVNRSRASLRHRVVPGSSPQQVRPGGSGEHLARAARAAQLLTAVRRRVAQHVSSKLRVARGGAGADRRGRAIRGRRSDPGNFELALAIRQAASPVGVPDPGPD